MRRCWTISNLFETKHKTVPFRERWETAFGHPQCQGFWIVYGKSGQGKSAFSMQLARELDELGYRVLYQSIEEENLTSFVHSAKVAGWDSQKHKILTHPGMRVEEMEEYLSSNRSPNVIIIDSIQYLQDQYGATIETLLKLKKTYRKKLFIFISHVKGNDMDGQLAYEIKRDCSLRIQVDRFRAFHRGRGSAGSLGYMDVWSERAEKMWLEKSI